MTDANTWPRVLHENEGYRIIQNRPHVQYVDDGPFEERTFLFQGRYWGPHDIEWRTHEEQPEMTQREIADALGISLGGVNYCLKGLVERGNVKVQNFRTSTNKLAYAYVLTPRGIRSRAALTKTFLARRLAEYEALRDEIESLGGALEDVKDKDLAQ